MAENTAGTLSAAEQAYFESEGETPFEEQNDAEAQAKADEAAAGVLDPDKAAKDAAEGREPDEKDKGRLVNYGALHQERERRKELEGKVSELENFKAVMADRWNGLLAAAKEQEKPADADPEPDPNTNIFAHNAWLKRQLDKVNTGLSERDKQAEEQQKASEYQGKVWEFWNQSAAAYKAKNADFEDAVKWMSGERTKQLKALSGLQPQFKTEAGIVAQINQELFEINVAAAQNGVSPAEYIFNMAKEWGYQGKAPAPVEKIELPDKLKGVEQAQAASRTVGQGNGNAGGDEISIDSLAAMPQKEFNAWIAVPANDRLFQKLMGG